MKNGIRIALAGGLLWLANFHPCLAQEFPTRGSLKIDNRQQHSITFESFNNHHHGLTIQYEQTYARRPNGELYWPTDPKLSLLLADCNCGVPSQPATLLTGTHLNFMIKSVGDIADALRQEVAELRKQHEATTRELRDTLLRQIAALPVGMAKDEQAYELLKARLTADLMAIFAEKPQYR